MRLLLITIIMILATKLAFAADSVNLTKGDLAVSTITQGRIVSAQMFFNPNCPINALCMPSTLVTIEFPLNGCVDKLGPVATRTNYNEVSGKYDIYVAATNISNKKSMVVRCIKQNTASYKMHIGPSSLDVDDLNLVLLK